MLGSDMSAYREAYEAFQAAFGKPVPLLALHDGRVKLPRGVKVVAAFGGKAALASYPDRVTLVYGIAPGILVGRDTHDGPTIKVSMVPEASVMLSRMLRIQPGLKRLAVLWASDAMAPMVEALEKAGAPLSVKIVSQRVDGADDLPGRLRGLKGRMDAFWVAPDPLMITAQNFEVLRQYADDNDIPFYAPTDALVAHGAAAAVWVGYPEIGRAAAAAAQSALAGEVPRYAIHLADCKTSINLTAAKADGLTVPPDAVRGADKVYP